MPLVVLNAMLYLAFVCCEWEALVWLYVHGYIRL